MNDSESGAGVSGASREIPYSIHRWNFWICAIEAAIFTVAVDIMGPSTLFPFLFKQIGIDNSWLGIFTVSTMVIALGGPIGSAIAGGREYKLPFCLKMGALQRLAFVLLPLGIMFFFTRPYVLLGVVILAWVLSYFAAGVSLSVFQVVVTSGVRESWWGRRMSTQNALSALGSLVASGFLWWINRHLEPPHNFILLGWLGVSLLFVSFYVVSRIREVPLPADRTFGRQSMGDAWRETYRILRHDSRVGWLVAARTFRTCGFLIGTYMTAVFIERCGLTNEQMWIPVVLATVPQIVNHIVSGWFVDRFGAKTAQTLSAFLVFLNSIQLFYCDTVGAFVVLYICTGFGGSLLMNSWTPLMMKLAPPATRAAYASTVTLAAAPGSVAVAILGMVLVYYSGFDHVFYVSMAGGLIASLLFFFKVPNLLQAPQE